MRKKRNCTIRVANTKVRLFCFRIGENLVFKSEFVAFNFNLPNDYPQSMFWTKNIYPCKPQFSYMKVGYNLRGIHRMDMFA